MLTKKDYITPKLACLICDIDVLGVSYGHDAAWDNGWGDKERS